MTNIKKKTLFLYKKKGFSIIIIFLIECFGYFNFFEGFYEVADLEIVLSADVKTAFIWHRSKNGWRDSWFIVGASGNVKL